MSQEPISVIYSLDEIFTRLEQKIDKLDNKLEQKIDGLENKIDKLEDKIDRQSEEMAGIKATLQAQQPLIQKIPDLAEKVGELKNWRQIVIIVLTTIISGSITWVIRGGTFKP
ncbi:hypothetical protein [Aphanothece sacrum]|uniref:Uncharacterized protein n=1 Tax=Aphanothece sacrum FPU1 TaxID=1920663 RepID=A0A401IF00_APHSA|nr:hypothetical protein [Aphanothece sacrum]GBF79867.1 hypothetical protein AsFPU1_1267 [Aphanothece sacrum FPU1]GBF83913.1 hypothetical protein AsFPU3_0957 [Aphanothece sacrum FPU3]